MRGARLGLLIAASALLFVYSLDCFSSGMMDAESMKCCGSMPCMPSNGDHDCCKTAVVNHSPYIQSSVAHSAAVTLEITARVVELHVPELPASPAGVVEACEHGPPRSLDVGSIPLLI